METVKQPPTPTKRSSHPVLRVEGQHFIKQQVALDFAAYDHCVFENCTMVYNGLGQINLTECEFNNSSWLFVGPARNTLDTLRRLNQTEIGRQLVTTIIQEILEQNNPRLPGMAANSNELALSA